MWYIYHIHVHSLILAWKRFKYSCIKMYYKPGITFSFYCYRCIYFSLQPRGSMQDYGTV